MTTDYRYQLDDPRLTGRRKQKTTCPQCGRRKCFVRYVDTRDDFRYLNDSVGRCDHEQSCGYHYRPAEYFRDHPWLTEAKRPYEPRPLPTPPPPPPLKPLSMELVIKSHSTQSVFWQWFSGDCARQIGLSPEAIRQVYENYCVGATHRKEVIFWQIDEHERVSSGHIMQYSSDGHRRGCQDWAHSRLIKEGLLPADFILHQCFFGQHLLPVQPEAHVCIVESEKTALIMAACYPENLWLATCGSSGLSAEKVECLRRRRFTLFPDSGCFEKWQKIMAQTTGLDYAITDQLEQYPDNTDLADLLLQAL